jgi:hypothetical protein
MEAVRTLKANLKLEGKPCGWCQAALALGDDAAVCTACEAPHHLGCWDGKAGCSTHACSNAPLRRLDAAAPAVPRSAVAGPASPFPAGFGAAAPAPSPAALPAGMMTCPRCTLMLSIGTPICPGCRAITSPDGLYHGPKLNAPGAVASLVLGLIGLVVCGVVLGPLAIWQASNAKNAISRDPIYGGGGMATAGMVLGIIGLVFGILWFMIGFGRGLTR